jgi:hypothetical protein
MERAWLIARSAVKTILAGAEIGISDANLDVAAASITS